MNKLLAYLNSLSPADQAAFAVRCKTTVGYLRKAISIEQQLREGLCIDIERESKRAVLCDDLRTDVDWPFLRSTGLAGTQIPLIPTDQTASAQPWDGVERREIAHQVTDPARQRRDVDKPGAFPLLAGG